jgi:ribosomal-protein-alanine acetyltransferase
MDYTVREVQRGDLEEIQQIEEESFLYPFSNEDFLNLYTNYRDVFFVAEKRGRVLGYVAGVRGFRKVTLASIAIRPKWRRKRIATNLTNCLMEKIRGKTKRLELQVRVSNIGAIKFYEKVGFRRGGILYSYYPEGEDAVLYYKDLQGEQKKF